MPACAICFLLLVLPRRNYTLGIRVVIPRLTGCAICCLLLVLPCRNYTLGFRVVIPRLAKSFPVLLQSCLRRNARRVSFKEGCSKCHASRFMRGRWHTNVAIRHLLAELLIWACLGKWDAPTWRRYREAYAEMGGHHRPYAQSMFGATLVSAVSWVISE